jgi:hypothetical protein
MLHQLRHHLADRPRRSTYWTDAWPKGHGRLCNDFGQGVRRTAACGAGGPPSLDDDERLRPRTQNGRSVNCDPSAPVARAGP